MNLSQCANYMNLQNETINLHQGHSHDQNQHLILNQGPGQSLVDQNLDQDQVRENNQIHQVFNIIVGTAR